MTRIHPQDPHVMSLAEHVPMGMISEGDYNFLMATFAKWAGISQEHDVDLNVVADMRIIN
jgi:hypothetical protein